MPLASQKGVVILLWYLGTFGALPAPPGWQTLRGERFALHYPAGWERLRDAEPAVEEPLAGFEPALRFGPSDPRQRGEKNLTVGLVPLAGKIGTRNMAALLSLEVDRPGMVARALQKRLPGWRCAVVTTVFDQARHRLWFRIEAHKEGQPSRAYVFVVFLTRQGAIYFQTSFRVEDGDEATLGTFRDVVNSFEMADSLRLREPSGRWGANPSSPYRVGFDLGHGFGRRHFTPFLVALALIFLGLLLAILDLLFFRQRLKAALIRCLQVPSLRQELAPLGRPQPPRSLWRPPLPWALGWQIALAHLLPFVVAPWYLRTPQLHGTRLFFVCYLLGYGLLAAALTLHYIPRTSRRLKYELLAVALSTLALLGTLSDPLLQAVAVGLDLPSLQGLFWGNYLSLAGYFYLTGVIVARLLRGPKAARRAASFYRVTYWLKRHLLGMVTLALWIPAGGGLGFAFVLLVAFYRLGEKAREHPILFLRSFGDPNTNLVLAEILMPTAGRYAPVLAVTHDRQPPEELYRRTNVISAAQLTTLPEPVWREWILAALPHCRAVVLDVSHEGDGLLWELEQARATLPLEKIAVLSRGPAPAQALPGPFFVRYQLGWRGRRAARKDLRGWLKRLPPVARGGA